MTPEERAIEVLRLYHHETHGQTYKPVELGRIVLAAIRAAEDAVIERCIRECEAHALQCEERIGNPEYPEGSMLAGAAAAAVIARRLRNLT